MSSPEGSMFVPRLVLVFLGLAVVPSSAAAAPPTETAKYAERCFRRIHLDPVDLKGPFVCKKGKLLDQTIEGARPVCPPGLCSTWLPDKCDYPAWLDNNCYGNSYVQVLPTPSNPKVTAVLLCRHKTGWLTGDKDFDDVAMIVHNEGNGETCWFQAPDGVPRLDGTKVPGPATETTDKVFWMSPNATKGVGCVGCHDNGPFMNSRWMNKAIGSDLQDGEGPYRNSEPPFGGAGGWPPPRFIKLKNNSTCTDAGCHKIAAAPDPRNRVPGMGAGPFRGPYERWIRRVTGEPHPNATSAGKAEPVVYWMPDGTKWTKAEWEKAHKLPGGSGKTVIDALIECGIAVGEGKPLPADCEEYTPKPDCPVAEKPDKSCPVLVCPVAEKPDGSCPVPIR